MFHQSQQRTAEGRGCVVPTRHGPLCPLVFLTRVLEFCDCDPRFQGHNLSLNGIAGLRINLEDDGASTFPHTFIKTVPFVGLSLVGLLQQRHLRLGSLNGKDHFSPFRRLGSPRSDSGRSCHVQSQSSRAPPPLPPRNPNSVIGESAPM